MEEKKMKKIISDVMKEQFAEHKKSFIGELENLKKSFRTEIKDSEKSIMSIISANFSTNQQRLDSISAELVGVIKSLEFTENELKGEMSRMKEKICVLELKTKDAHPDFKVMKEKLEDLEDRSRRNNIRVDGVMDVAGESWEDSERKVHEILMQKMGFDIGIQRCHRV